LQLAEETLVNMNLTDEKLEAVRNGEPFRFTQGDTDFVLIRADVYDRTKSLFDDGPLTTDERQRLLQAFGKRAGWEDPELDVYETYRKKP
jgi:hypothetical protein